MGVSIQRHAPATWSLEEGYDVHCAEVWVGFQAGLKCMEKKKSFDTQRDSNPELWYWRNIKCVFIVCNVTGVLFRRLLPSYVI